MLIEAAVGLGKTSLLTTAVERARTWGFRVLRARGSDLETEFTYGCVRQLFEAPARDPGTDALFSGAARLAEPMLCGEPATPPTTTGPDTTFALLHGLYWFAANLAERAPLLLAIDDAHWADPASIRFAAYLSQRLDGIPALLLMATRPRPDARVGDDVLARVGADPGTVRLAPRPLSEAASAQVVRAVLTRDPPSELTRACHQATAGNPFYLTAIARQLSTDDSAGGEPHVERIARMGADSVATSVLLTISSLHPSAATLVRALAVLGEDVRLDDLAQLGELAREAATEALDALVRAGLVTVRDDAVGFAHPVVRQAVYQDLPLQTRGAIHARAAALLHEAGAEAQRVATHLLLGPPAAESWAIATFEDAARRSLRDGDPESARTFLARAVDLVGERASAALLGLLGRAEMLTASDGAIGHLQDALERTSDWTERSAIVEDAMTAHIAHQRFGAAEALLTTHIESAPPGTPEGQLLWLRARMALMRLDAVPSAAARELDLLSPYASTTDPAGRAILVARAQLALMRGEPVGRHRDQLDAAADAILADTDAVTPTTATLLYCQLLMDAPGVDRTIQHVVDRCRATGSLFGYLLGLFYRASVAQVRGDLRRAETDVLAAIERVDTMPIGLAPCLALYVEVLADAGRHDVARRVLAESPRAEVEDERRRAGGELAPTCFQMARARLELEEGRPERALELIAERNEEFESLGFDYRSWRPLAVAAHLALGDRDAAERLAETELDVARRLEVPRHLGRALRHAAAAAETDARRAQLLQESTAVLGSSPARLELARSLVDLGAHLRATRRLSEAREQLEQGYRLAEKCGAAPLSARARVELAAMGVRPPGLDTSPLDTLTASERQVCELAATGLSNPEIAQALFVTRKTVETHLGHAYRKLGIAGRAQLPDLLDPPLA